MVPEIEDLSSRAILEISRHELDREALEQSKLYRFWASKLAEAEYQVGVKESAMEVLEAELAGKIRANPKKYIKGEFPRGSPSEAAIKAAIIQTPEYQKAKRRHLKAKLLV